MRKGTACEGCPQGATSRREVIAGGAALTAGAMGLTPDFAAAADGGPPEKLFVQPGDRFEIVKGDLKGELLRADTLTAGAKFYESFPQDPASGVLRRKNRLNRLLALRIDPAAMSDETKARATEDGVLVFSAVCTHKGCTIKSWMEEELNLRCHCHLSVFSATDVGRVLGGPAKFELPMVPLTVDGEGYVVAASGFTADPGGKTK